MDWIEQAQERGNGRLFELVSYNAYNVLCVAFEHNVEGLRMVNDFGEVY